MTSTKPQQLIAPLQSGESKSAEMTQHFIDANKKNVHLNAMCLQLYEAAIGRAKELDKQREEDDPIGLLHGLPITIKECFDLPGTPSTFGVTHRTSDIPDKPDIYVEALQEAGAVILGKSNVSQLLAFIECDNRVYGRTSHPQNTEFSCGGSSGGEGALVGAGLSPLGLGTDIGGSIRVPAAVNGACGIKPTGERLPDKTRLMPEQDIVPIKSAVGPISQDAFTLHTALQVMNDKASTQWPVEPLLDYCNVDIASLKIGYFADDGIFPVCQSVRDGIQKSVLGLKESGAEVMEYRFPDLHQAEDLFYAGMSLEKGRYLFNVLGKDKPVENLAMLHAISPTPLWLKKLFSGLMGLFGQNQQSRILKLVGRYGEQDAARLEGQITAYREKVIQSMENAQLDAVISPILPVPAYLHNSFKDMLLGGTYSLVNNVTGFPAGVACVGKVENPISEKDKVTYSRVDLAERQALKCSQKSQGLPQSVQITAMPWRENIVLALIDQLHQP